MFAQLRPALILFAVLSIVTGMAYPLLVTGIAQTVFPKRANGSLEVVDGKERGSRLIGQPFSASGYFWSRPSATSPAPYDASGSTGSNIGPTNPALVTAVHDRVAALRQADPTLAEPIPVDVVTTSGSGLDPDISVAGAMVQVNRVAAVRGVPAERLRQLVQAYSQGRTLRFLGEPRVNVLLLNLGLDRLHP
jgi:K+-transporting ATPase ATPase C chain